MNQKLDRSYMLEIVNSQMLGQKRREEEFEELTKGLISYYYDLIKCQNKKTFLEATYNWITKNIMTLTDKEEFIPWVIQISTVCALCTSEAGYLKDTKLDALKKGISYPYLNVSQDTEEFIPSSLDVEGMINVTNTFMDIEDNDTRVLAGFFFMGGLAITDIAEYTEGKITDIAAGVQYLKNCLLEQIAISQKTPEGDYLSLAEKNIIQIGLEEGFYQKYNKENIKEIVIPQGNQTDSKAVRLKDEILKEVEDLKDTPSTPKVKIEKKEIPVEKEIPQPLPEPENDTIIKDIAQEQREKRITLKEKLFKESVRKDEKEVREKKAIDVKFYALMGVGVALAIMLFALFISKVVTIIVDTKDRQNDIIIQEAEDNQESYVPEPVVNEQITRITEAYQNRVGTVTIILSGTTSEAPKKPASEESYYFYGSNYEFDLQYSFTDDSELTSYVDSAEVSLAYTDRTEHLSSDTYEERKNLAAEEDFELYEFDDENHNITQFADWKETNQHTAFDYEPEDCVTTWLSVLDSNKNAIEAMGDGCDLLPVMEDNLTTTVNGKTYELVFYSATGYYIKDDETDDLEGHSTNYTIICDAYLETF